MSETPDWAASSGDAWAERWRDTDRALSDLAPKLQATILSMAPEGPFRAFDVGCGPGTTSLELATSRPDASIVACDLSPALVRIAEERLSGAARVLLGDAEAVAGREGPFDLIFSRHGVMFFDDPVHAFGKLRQATRPGGALVFSCFQSWERNPWASKLTSATAGRALPSPGREPSGFALAEPDYVTEILTAAGWTGHECRPAPFRYIAGEGDAPVEAALSFLTDIGPASRLIQSLPEAERPQALDRLRGFLEDKCRDGAVEFPAAAWIWTARAEGESE